MLDDFQLLFLKEGGDPCRINIGLSDEIPDTYIPFESVRIYYYRCLMLAKNDLEELGVFKEMEDRFGSPPYQVIWLFKLSRFKRLSKDNKIISIFINSDGGTVTFSKNTKVSNMDNVMDIFVKDMDNMNIISRLSEENISISISKKIDNIEDRIDYLDFILS